jgi:predicted amidohydrolase
MNPLQGNYERIMASIRIAKEKGATLRVGPELEIPYAISQHISKKGNELITCTEAMDVTITSLKVALVFSIIKLWALTSLLKAILSYTHGKY